MAKLDLVLVLLVVCAVALPFQSIHAQQQYDNATGYVCSAAVQQNCVAYAYYRTQGTNSTLNSTATLFNTTPAAIANASKSATAANTLLGDRTGLTIPLDCSCVNGTYQAPTTYTVVSGDTMAIIANRTFEGLVAFPAIIAANPSITPETMRPGEVLKIPVRCACPSQTQMTAGTKSLLSYAIFPEEDLLNISAKYDIPVAEVMVANMLPNNTIKAFTTILVPLKDSSSGSSPPDANAGSAGSRADCLLIVAVMALLAMQSLLF